MSRKSTRFKPDKFMAQPHVVRFQRLTATPSLINQESS
jgi:hypothetical protein